jgi:uncharacterized repeat protein (TIGR01451 family)
VVAVGAYEAHGKAGAVYLFHSNGEAWLPFQVPDQAAAGDQLGFSLAFEGRTLVAGAPFAGGCGAVYRATVDLGTGTAGPFQRLDAPCEPGAELGSSVAIRGGLIAVGARGAGKRAGQIYVFDGSALVPLPGGGSAAGDELGQSVAIDGDRIVAGAPFGSSQGIPATGKVLIFTRGQSSWEAAPLSASPSTGDAFGYAVAAQGGRIAVGAPLAHGEAGEVDVYKDNGEVTRVPGTSARIQLGVSVAFAGSQVFAGARWYDNKKGAVFPIPSGTPLQSDPSVSSAELGFDLAYADGLLVAGAFLESGQGAAYVFAEPQKIVLKPVEPVSENAGSVSLVVATSDEQPVRQPVSVQLKTKDRTALAGSDYVKIDRTVTIASNESMAEEVRVTLLRDELCDGEKTFQAILSDAQGAELGTPQEREQTVTIRDGTTALDLPAGPLAVPEGPAGAAFSVKLLCAPQPSVHVTVQTAPWGTASPAAFDLRPGQSRQVTVRSPDDSSCVPRAESQITVRAGSVTRKIPVRIEERSVCVSGRLRLCVDPDDTVLYAVTLRNDGAVAQPDRPGSIELFDPLPPRVTVVTASADHGTATVDFVGNSVAWNGSIPAYRESGETVTVWIVGALAPLPPEPLVRNQATLTYDRDGAAPLETLVVGPADFFAGSTPCDPQFPY